EESPTGAARCGGRAMAERQGRVQFNTISSLRVSFQKSHETRKAGGNARAFPPAVLLCLSHGLTAVIVAPKNEYINEANLTLVQMHTELLIWTDVYWINQYATD